MKDHDWKNAMACECIGWCEADPTSHFLGNGHHTNCKYFKPNEAAMDLLRQLVEGIRWWASQEDGVPDELWAAYARAYFITMGKIPNPDEAL